MLTVISGGQTGVDQAALWAARDAGFPTAGYAPGGWMTETGPAPWLSDFGLTEFGKGYPPRTRKNIESSHATLIVADAEPLEGGTKLTFDIAFRLGGGDRGIGLFVGLTSGVERARPEDAATWLQECIRTRERFILNVAGPRESKAPGIGGRAQSFLWVMFQLLKNGGEG